VIRTQFIAAMVLVMTFAARNGVEGLAVQAAQTPEEAARDAAGYAALERVCAGCHGLDVIETGFRTRAEWNSTINLMKGNGADGTAEQFAQLSDYLIRYQSSLNVNKATADEIGAWLDVDGKMAQAVVDHRSMNGGFKTIDDLKKVPGIDVAKVDARKNRALF
jgi:competence protein ComEA